MEWPYCGPSVPQNDPKTLSKNQKPSQNTLLIPINIIQVKNRHYARGRVKYKMIEIFKGSYIVVHKTNACIIFTNSLCQATLKTIMIQN